VVELDNTTASVGQKYFKETTTLKYGITIGLKYLLEAPKVLMLASGFKKAPVIKKALEEEISEQMPASIIRTHPNSEVLLDEEAASMLSS
jgi:6-phosphogluconolactonase/glucosamine-6-phosphate isomerase/deaminase